MKKLIGTAVPHSWAIRDWPSEIFPSSSDSARWLIRCRKPDLVAAGALVRIAEVPDFEIAPNRKVGGREAKEGQQ